MPNTSKKETILLIFAVVIVIGGIVAIFVKPQWKIKIDSNSKNNFLPEKQNQISSRVPIISTAELKDKIDNNENIYLLDVQSEESYLEKHLPGSFNIPYDQLETRKKELPNNKEIIVICTNDSTCQTSTKAAELLQNSGYSNIKDFKEGVLSWEEQNLPIITGFEATYKSISIEQLKQKLDNQENIAILDIREKSDFNKSHIKNAIHMPFEEISKKIKELPRNKELIVYDKTNNRSKLITEMLTKKGFTQAMNLQASFQEWLDKNYPIE